MSCILVIDVGTTGIKVFLMDEQGVWIASVYQSLPSQYPYEGWVEQDPKAIWSITQQLMLQLLKKSAVDWSDISGIGLSNQRETVILWDKVSGEPVGPAIVWQCRRTSDFCNDLKHQDYAESIIEKTGLVIDPYFSASKVRWALENWNSAQQLVNDQRLVFGTVNTWILWNLSAGEIFVTELTNAARTQLLHVEQCSWDEDLLKIFKIPRSCLPQIRSNSEILGESDPKLTGGVRIPLSASLGDQQSALLGQRGWKVGASKCTYGTGAFLMMHTGSRVRSTKGLITTLGLEEIRQSSFVQEASLFSAGSMIEWLLHEQNWISSYEDLEDVCSSESFNRDVFLLPAFQGLGAPYWKPEARASFVGISLSTTREQLIQSVLEAIVYQTRQVLEIMEEEWGQKVEVLQVDGGLTRSKVFVQMLANGLQKSVLRHEDPDLTARGAGYLAGVNCGIWDSLESTPESPYVTEVVHANVPSESVVESYGKWVGLMDHLS